MIKRPGWGAHRTLMNGERLSQSLGGALGITLLSAFETWRFQALSQGAIAPAGITNVFVAAYDEIFLTLAVCVMIAFGFALFFSGQVRPTLAEDPKAQEHPSERSNASAQAQ